MVIAWRVAVLTLLRKNEALATGTTTTQVRDFTALTRLACTLAGGLLSSFQSNKENQVVCKVVELIGYTKSELVHGT